MRGLLTSPSSVTGLTCRPRMSVGEAVSELELVLLNDTVGMWRPKSNRRQVVMVLLNHQKAGVYNFHNDLRKQWIAQRS